jgi:hypothetical protein
VEGATEASALRGLVEGIHRVEALTTNVEKTMLSFRDSELERAASQYLGKRKIKGPFAYHYTNAYAVKLIIVSGVILMSEVWDENPWKFRGVWFSTDPHFDYGMGSLFTDPQGRQFVLDFQQQAKFLGLARLSVRRQKLDSLVQLWRNNEISDLTFGNYAKGASEALSTVHNWYVARRDIHLDEVFGIELHVDGQWEVATAERLEQVSAKTVAFKEALASGTWPELLGVRPEEVAV